MYWLQGKVYPVSPNGELLPNIIKQTEYQPFATEIILDQNVALSDLTKLQDKIAKAIVGVIEKYKQGDF